MHFSTLFLIVALASLAAQPALAQTCTTEWAAAVSGTWSDDGNWTNGAPDAGDTACITAPGTYVVTLDRRQALDGLVVGGASGVQTLIMDGTFDPLGSGTVGPNGRVELTSSENCATCDGLPVVTGTLTVEGTLVHREFTGLVSQGGIVDVAPSGTLRVLTDINNGVNIGTSDDATPSRLVIRGTMLVDEEVPASTTQGVRINSYLDLDGGTLSILEGNVRVNGEGGTWTGGTLDVREETELTFFPTSGAANTFELSGTITGTPAGLVQFSSGSTLAAGPGSATLDLGGTGLEVSPGSGQAVFFTSAGGTLTNTGLLTVRGNGLRLDGATLRNEADIRIYTPLIMQNGATLDNAAAGTLDIVDQGSITGGDSGQLLSTGRILATLDALTSGTSRVNVPAELNGTEVEVVGGRTLQFSEGALNDVEFDVAEAGQVLFSNANSNGLSGDFAAEGTLSGDVQGTLTLSGARFLAGSGTVTLAFVGNGMTLRGYGLGGDGGDFVNTGLITFINNVPEIRGVALRNEGELRVDNATLRLAGGATVTNADGATAELINNAGLSDPDGGGGTLVNEGLVLKTGGGTTDFRSTLRSQPGSELRVLDGLVTLQPPASEALPEGAAVTGTGIVRFETGLDPEGIVSPGTEDQPLDTLGVFTSFRPAPQARLVIDVDEDGQSDLLTFPSVNANIELGGTLVVRLQPGYIPEVGDEFEILQRTANPIVFPGEFDAIEVEGDLPEGVSFVTEKPAPGTLLLRAVSGVTIEPLAMSTSEDGAPVQFVVRSAQPVAAGNALEVPLAFEGTATRYLDYVVDISGSAARIPAGETETTVTLFPLRDDLDESAETVTLRILPGGDAGPGDPDTASLALADGPSTSELAVGGIAPSRGGTRGQVSATVFGQGFEPGSQVRLEQGGTVIEGTSVTTNETGTGATARFDLDGAPLGTYDVVVESGGDTNTLVGGFEVEEATGLAIWADISGTPRPRQNRWSTYTLTVGNASNQDLHDTIVLLRVTADVEYEINGPILLDTDEVPPDPEDNGYVGLNVETASVIPVYLYRIPAGGINTIPVRIRPTGSVGTGAGVSYELYPPDPEASFTWTGDFNDLDADTEAGHITNWVAFFGAIGWAFDFLTDDLAPGDETAPSAARLATTSLRNVASLRAAKSMEPQTRSAARTVEHDGMRLLEGDLNNEWDRPREDLTLEELVDYYADITNLGDNPLDAVTVTLLAGSERGLNLFLSPAASLVGLRISIATGNPWAVAFGAVRLSLSLGLTAIGEKAPGRIICEFTGGDPCGGGGGGAGGGSSTGGPGGGPAGGIGGSAGGKVGGSVDPNDKLGPSGYSDLRYRTTEATAAYTIRFENLETATFPAQEVFIVDDLDTSVYDLSTFSLGPITLPGRVIEPPVGVQSFSTTVNLEPELPALLVINAALDPETGRVVWTFATLDPETNDLPEDGAIGFLPPNQNPPEGEGAVSFTIDMLPDLPTDTEVANLAEIVFDLNEPIVTPVWVNTVDLDAPVSSVQPIEPAEGPVTIEVEGSDLGAGIQTYALFVSEADGPFELYATSTEPTFEFEGEVGVLYGFYSIAADFVLNVEGPKDEPEATIVYGTVANEGDSSLPREVTLGMPYPNPMRGATTLRWGLPDAGRVTVQVYDLLGREVARLADDEATLPGWHETQWQAPRLASGVYIVRLRAESGQQTVSKTQRIVIVR